MKIVTTPVVRVDEFYFYMHPPPFHKDFAFWKNIFELVYLFDIVLKSLDPIKAGNISQEDGCIASKIYYFNFMVSYLNSFNPFYQH